MSSTARWTDELSFVIDVYETKPVTHSINYMKEVEFERKFNALK